LFWGIPTDLTPSEKISEITNPGGTEAELLEMLEPVPTTATTQL